VPYWLVVKDFTGESQSLLSDIDDLDGLVATLGARPSSDAFGYKALARVSGAFEDKGFGIFAPTATLVDALAQSAAQATVSFTAGIGIEDVTPGGACAGRRRMGAGVRAQPRRRDGDPGTGHAGYRARIAPGWQPGNGYTWPLAQEATDSSLGRVNASLKVEIEASRDGHLSWQKQVIQFECAGYGLRYGQYYGGI